jgi:hypothetical protein
MNPLKIALAGAAAMTLASLAPAVTMAQPMDAPAIHHDWSLHDRVDWLRTRLDHARADGSISHAEFDRVRDEIQGISGDESTLRGANAGALTSQDRDNLERRLDAVADQIHWLRQTSLQRPW